MDAAFSLFLSPPHPLSVSDHALHEPGEARLVCRLWGEDLGQVLPPGRGQAVAPALPQVL